MPRRRGAHVDSARCCQAAVRGRVARAAALQLERAAIGALAARRRSLGAWAKLCRDIFGMRRVVVLLL